MNHCDLNRYRKRTGRSWLGIVSSAVGMSRTSRCKLDSHLSGHFTSVLTRSTQEEQRNRAVRPVGSSGGGSRAPAYSVDCFPAPEPAGEGESYSGTTSPAGLASGGKKP